MGQEVAREFAAEGGWPTSAALERASSSPRYQTSRKSDVPEVEADTNAGSSRFGGHVLGPHSTAALNEN
jgi:hypothetical protein